jgi:hypothetical protein
MKLVVIENPVLNSPFEAPERHFKFDDEGITNEIVESRRVRAWEERAACEITPPRPTRYRFGFTDPCDAANTLRARSASERLP